jgi:chromosome segregation ATPase
MIRIYFFLFLILIIGSASAAGYKYYVTTQETIRILTENNTKLEIAVQTNEEAIDSLQKSYAAATAENKRINEEYASIRRQNNELSKKLESIDLTAAALNNPESIQTAVNKGTENAARCFELLSGAELNERERNSEDERSFNKECPWLYDYYKSSGMLESTPTEVD